MKNHSLQKWIAIFFLVLLVNTGYVAAFSSATVFYMTNVLFHFGLGVVLSLVVIFTIGKRKDLLSGAPVAFGFFLLAFGFGAALVYVGNVYANAWLLWSHIAAGALGVAALIPLVWKKAANPAEAGCSSQRLHVALVMLVRFRPSRPHTARRFPIRTIASPIQCPHRYRLEGRRRTEVAVLPLVGQDQRRRHHPIELLHGFGDLRRVPQGHLRAVEELDAPLRVVQQPVLPEVDRVHAGRGRHAAAASGAPAATITPSSSTAASTGRSRSRSTRRKRRPGWPACRATPSCTWTARMGNGGFTIEYPPLHELATSQNPYIRAIDYFLTYLNPEPHQQTFMKPFMRQDSAEFCSTCHKVHLDVPVNNYRWFRGFNDYDNWQASGVSGQGARSFYYPPKTSDLRAIATCRW